MSKKLFLIASLVTLIFGAQSLAGVGVFDNAKDVGGPAGIGSTVYEGYQWKDDPVLVEQYLITASGGDIWGNWDQFHYAYKELSGDVRVSGSFEWVARSNDWAKMGVMIRDLGSDGDAVQFNSVTRKNIDGVFFQRREGTGWGSGSYDVWGIGSPASIKLGIQRVTVSGFPLVEALYDNGGGWQVIGTPLIAWNLPDTAGFGVAVTSHDNNHLAQARAYDVRYEKGVQLLSQLNTVPADGAVDECPSDNYGFKIRSIKTRITDGWGYAMMNELLDTGAVMGIPGYEEGTRIDRFCNVRDSGDGQFGDNRSFPGIDPFEHPAADPAAGDDDDNFATEILACIELTAGAHMIGIASDDGAILEIGGVEVGRTGEWKGADTVDLLFYVDADGKYPLRVRTLEGGGGSSIELHEVLANGDGTFTRILLGDVDAGGSPVYIPEPATIALLGFGGLALLRIRKRG
jgi:hypothetical protein